jgi:hypothetical protein
MSTHTPTQIVSALKEADAIGKSARVAYLKAMADESKARKWTEAQLIDGAGHKFIVEVLCLYHSREAEYYASGGKGKAELSRWKSPAHPRVRGKIGSVINAGDDVQKACGGKADNHINSVMSKLKSGDATKTEEAVALVVADKEKKKAEKGDPDSPENLCKSAVTRVTGKKFKDTFTEESIARVVASIEALEVQQAEDVSTVETADLANALESLDGDAVKTLLAALITK